MSGNVRHSSTQAENDSIILLFPGRKMMISRIACEALRNGKRLELRYDGYSRIVEVHAVGITQDGNDVMRVWQVRGGSNSGERQGWKLFRLDEAFSAHMIDEESEAPRRGYARGDKVMSIISCQI